MDIQDSGGRYHEIIQKSANLFRIKGFAATSIRDIGDSMGLTSAALYYHFKNKDQVLLAVMEQGLSLVTEAVSNAVASEPDSLSKLRGAVRAHIQMSLEHQDFAAVLLQDVRHLSDASRKIVIPKRDAYEELWAQLLSSASENHFFRPDLDLHLLRLMIFGTLNLVTSWYRPEGEYNPRQIADTYFDYIFNGITETHHA